MAQLFKRSTNPIARFTLFGGAVLLFASVWILVTLDRSDYSTGRGIIRKQPIPFSHAHHISGLGIDCRYCHTSVEESSFAGVPPTATCMNCHQQIWADSPLLQPVRDSYRSGAGIRWVRANDLPDYVYFNHSIHIAKGIGCVTCHGPVDQMPIVWQEKRLQMEWCLGCHRHPERYVRPRAAVFDPTWQPPADALRQGRRLVEEYDIAAARDITNCSTCHR